MNTPVKHTTAQLESDNLPGWQPQAPGAWAFCHSQPNPHMFWLMEQRDVGDASMADLEEAPGGTTDVQKPSAGTWRDPSPHHLFRHDARHT
jgi:hypothetical protein